MMEVVAELPTFCRRVVFPDESTLAVCGRREVYFFQLPLPAAPAPVRVSLPRRPDHYAPGWGGVCYAEGGSVYFCGGAGGLQRSRELFCLPPTAAADKVEAIKVLFGTTLVVRTTRKLFFYAFDPASGAGATQPSLIGTVVLPFAAATVMMDGFSCSAAFTGSVDRNFLFAVVVYSEATQTVGAVLVSVGPTRVAVQQQTRDGALLLPHDTGATLHCWSIDWSRREVFFVFSNGGETSSVNTSGNSKITTSTLSLDTMEWAASSIVLGQLLAAPPADIVHTHTGDLWAVDNSCCGAVKLLNLSASCILREVELPSTGRGKESEVGEKKKKKDGIFLTTRGSSIFLLIGKTIFELRTDDGGFARSGATTLCDWFMLRAASEASDAGLWQKRERRKGTKRATDNTEGDNIDKILAFVRGDSSGLLDVIVRDCRYVSCALGTTGGYRHAILDAIDTPNSPGDYCSGEYFLRYIAVAQSLHPATILRVLNVRDPSVRLALAVLLAAKPSLAAGGVRLLEWGAPARFLCREAGQTGSKRFAAELCDSALAALAAGALGTVGLLCAVADVVLVAALGADRRTVVSREEAAAEVAIAEAVGVFFSYAQWALATAPMLGTMTAHVGPVCSGKKETAVRDRVAHVILTSRNVHIEPLNQLGKTLTTLR